MINPFFWLRVQLMRFIFSNERVLRAAAEYFSADQKLLVGRVALDGYITVAEAQEVFSHAEQCAKVCAEFERREKGHQARFWKTKAMRGGKLAAKLILLLEPEDQALLRQGISGPRGEGGHGEPPPERTGPLIDVVSR